VTVEEIRRLVRLHGEFLNLLAQLAVLPHGSTANWNSSGGKSSEHPGGKRPAGEAHPDGERLLEAWERARTSAEKGRVLEEGRQVLEAWKHSARPDKAEDPRVLRREIQSKRGWTDREVAQAMRLSVREVHEARLAAKCCPAKGYPYVGCGVIELANRGNSVRQIELMVGVSKSVVDRTLRKAA
jgi:transposase